MTDLRELLAFNIKFHRARLGISQEKLAEHAHTAANYIACIEAKRRFPSVEVLEKIAYAFNIDTPELFSMESVQIDSINGLKEEMVGEITRIIADYTTKKLNSLKPKKIYKKID
ncbi:transcriptional regulator [Spirochaetia bacterium]|nr:transcriptional regulator [Spirochaetia bacterium]